MVTVVGWPPQPIKILCQVTQIFQIQLFVIEFIIKMSHTGFMPRGTWYVGGGGGGGGRHWNTQISNFMKIRPVGIEFFHADGQIDMAKLTVAFRNFANSPEKSMNTKCVFWFYLLLSSETFLILRRIQWDIILNVCRSSRKVPVIFVIF